MARGADLPAEFRYFDFQAKSVADKKVCGRKNAGTTESYYCKPKLVKTSYFFIPLLDRYLYVTT